LIPADLTESGGSAAEFVDKDEGVPVGVLQDDARLGQLHHEGALAVENVVGGTDPVKILTINKRNKRKKLKRGEIKIHK
jgi:hypothetical protein